MKTIIVLAILAVPLAAHAQVVFPADAAYRPLRCGSAPMTDAFADEAGALNERDIVGDAPNPAGLRASDATNLYLRMRLEDDPAPGGTVAQFSWGMEFDINNDPATYEVLILVEGIAGPGGTVELFQNSATTLANDPNDPADTPALQTYTFANNARTVAAPGTTFGGSPDFFLDFAVPWSALQAAGLDRDTPVHVWAGSSTAANSLDGDLACHAGGTGAPTLSGTASDPTTGDPNNPGGGGGSGHLEGGGGCAATRGGPAWLVLALVPLIRRRRSSGCRAPRRA
jgi:hypothetical protein